MNKPHKFLLSAGLASIVISIFSITSCLGYQGGSGIPSCHDDIAVKRTEPGISPDCTPPILNQESSQDILKNFVVNKIKGKWYLFLSADDFEGKFDVASRWRSISLLISAVESLFAEKAECFLVRVPETDEEKAALLEGKYPERLIAASAKHVALTEEEESSKKWPEFHHRLFYKITVY